MAISFNEIFLDIVLLLARANLSENSVGYIVLAALPVLFMLLVSPFSHLQSHLGICKSIV